MEEFSLPHDPLHQIEKTAVHAIDLIRLFEAYHAVGTAQRAAGSVTEMIPKSAGNELFAFTLRTFVNRHVAEPLHERPMNPL
jgi:hypothetical protein